MAEGYENNLYGEVTITPYSGVSLNDSSVTRIGNLVAGTIKVGVSANANEWKNLVMISPPPKKSGNTNDISVPAVRTGDGSYLGMIAFHTNSAVVLYSKQTLTGNELSFTFAYKTN